MNTYIGLDLSLTSSACVAVDDAGKIISQVLVKSKPLGDTHMDEVRRLAEIRDSVMNLVKLQPDRVMVCLEGMAFAVRNATALTQVSFVNYAIREQLTLMGTPFVVVQPTTLKKFVTGKGNCQKDLMMIKTLENFGVALYQNDVCDAFGLARIARELCNPNYVNDLPVYQQEVVSLLKKQV